MSGRSVVLFVNEYDHRTVVTALLQDRDTGKHGPRTYKDVRLLLELDKDVSWHELVRVTLEAVIKHT